MATDLSFGNSIIKAFIAGHESGLEQKKLKQKAKQDRLDREDRRKIHEDTLNQAKEHFDASQALAQASAKLRQIEARSKIARDFAETGINVSNQPVVQTPTSTGEQDQQMLNQNFKTHFDPLTLQKITQSVGNKAPSFQQTMHLPEEVGGDITTNDPYTTTRMEADRQRQLLTPKTEQQVDLFRQQKAIEHPFAMQLEQMKEDARYGVEIAKFKEKQQENAQRFKDQQSLIKLRAFLRPSGASKGDSLLTPTDLEKLNSGLPPDKQLPYGTTKDEAARWNITPQKPRTAAEQAKLDGFIALRSELTELRDLGKQTGYSEHKPLIGGPVGAVKNKLGLGTEQGASYRTKLGKLNAEYIHSTYGSVFSKNEQQLANTWLSNLSESGKTADAKLGEGENYLTKQIDLMLAPASQTKRGSTPPDGKMRKVITPTSGPRKGVPTPMVSNDKGLSWEPE